MTDRTRVEWHDWGDAAFEEARDRDLPVLLSLTATWCEDCHEMDAATYGEPRIAANVNDGFVPVRVDVDRHPRVRERYNMGGFPSTVFATGDGRLLTGAGYLTSEGMRQVLDRVRDLWDQKGADAGRVPRALAGDDPPVGRLSSDVEAHLAGQLDAKYDPEFAGWGTDAKFPLPRTVEFALKREREQALRTLEATARNLLDSVDGGFFRYAGSRDWSDVHRAKLLDANAGLVRAFANAYLYSGDDTYRDPAAATVDYLAEELWSGVAFGGSQGPGEDGYYDRDAADRAAARTPRTDLTGYAGPNALAADALLTYHAYTDDERAAEFADRTLDYLERSLVDPDASGVSDGRVVRFVAEGERGEADVLEDVARVVGAFVRARQVRGEGLAVARAVADRALEVLRDDPEPDSGGASAFRDGPAAGPGLLDRPLRPIDGNVDLAEALFELSVLTGEPRYREAAEGALSAFAGAADRMSVQVAGYGSAVARLLRDPLVVAVADDPGSDLHRAALRVADHEKLVVPDADAPDVSLPGLDADLERGSAVVLPAADPDPVSTPDALMAAVAEHEP